MRVKLLNITAFIMAVALTLTAGSIGASAKSDTAQNSEGLSINKSLYKNYNEYQKENSFKPYKGEKIILTGGSSNLGEPLGDADNSNISLNVSLHEDALYNIYIKFKPLKNQSNIKLGIEIDGEIPFSGAENIELTSDWINDGEVRRDKKGNEIAPEQIKSEGYYERYLSDKTGVVISPYEFALKSGEHKITLVDLGYSLEIAELALVAPERAQSYKQISKDYKLESNGAEPIIIQAEKANIKNDNTLIPMATSGNAGMTPVDAQNTLINYIGGTNWNLPTQKLTWKFSVEKAGYYKFGARYKQNELVNGESWRSLTIDGKTPFTEASELRFAFGTGWQHYELKADNESCYIYLDKGEHTLSLETTLGELASFYDRLNKSVASLGDLYLQIVMITGETPDINRDYELFRQIPNFNDTLTSINKELKSLVRDVQQLSGERGSQYTAAINNMSRVITQMIEAPYIAHIYVKDFYTNYTTVSSWLSDMKKMPLALDEIRLVPYGKDFSWDEPNFFEKLWFGAKRFIYTFTENYIKTGSEKNKKLTLWVNWGRDQTMALDTLIRDSFTSETDIDVELQIVSNSLINGLLAGNFPDLQLHLSRTDPVNYGMRGALTDLTEFPDYKEVLGRFMEGADTPYWHNGKLYALPDQQTFYCMFYRKDVFEQLGLDVPITWNDFLDCATTIQRYNMAVYVPFTQITTTTTVNSGMGSLHLYPTLIAQSGLNLYNDELNATRISEVEAIEVFTKWTEMYSDYGYLKEADFYNRFRNGSMPLGIAQYTTYMTLYSAAPEIYGRWKIANVPATENGNGYVAGGGTGCGIVRESKNQNEAWEFLKWWTDADTQSRYSSNVEAILGMLGRIPTSNVEAFKKLSWDPEHKDAILKQWESVTEMPEVPGGYYLTRAVDQAFWAVINDKSNPKDEIIKWSKVADNEITRKLKEYS